MGAYLRLVDVDEASGVTAEEYAAALERAGKVFNVVKSMSLSPGALRAALALYREIMFGPSELSRAERELLALVVSRANDCFYWIRAHQDDLRAEGADERLVEQAGHDYHDAELEPRVRALCDFAAKVTYASREVRQEDVDELRGHGWSDAAISDAIQVTAYFNYINRVADAVGIEGEPEWQDGADGRTPAGPEPARPADR